MSKFRGGSQEKERLGPLVKQRRLQLGLSRAALASRAGVDASVIHRIEAGDRPRPTPHTLGGLAGALDLDLALLYAAVSYPVVHDLPDLGPYLRIRYGLSDKAIQEAVERLQELLDSDSPPPTSQITRPAP